MLSLNSSHSSPGEDGCSQLDAACWVWILRKGPLGSHLHILLTQDWLAEIFAAKPILRAMPPSLGRICHTETPLTHGLSCGCGWRLAPALPIRSLGLCPLGTSPLFSFSEGEHRMVGQEVRILLGRRELPRVLLALKSLDTVILCGEGPIV